ncbi:MAG: family 10 glycosylhydrolase [Pirellulales bacterium]
MLCALAAALVEETAQAETNLQLRIAWGGGARRPWTGTISLTEGRLSLHRPLGIEADEPGSIWVEQNRLEIRQRSPREYDGVDVFLDAPLDAKLLVSISADPRAAPVYQEIKLGDLIQKPYSRPLDDRHNRLLVRRAPGDLLRVRLPGDSLVFSTDERINVDLKPHLLPVADGANVRIKARLIAKGTGEEHWSQDSSVTKPAGDDTSPPVVSLDVALPSVEGVYDLVIEASERHPLRWIKPMATRQIQLMVVSENRPTPATPPHEPWTKVLEIDPANPGWTDRLKNLPLMPGWRQGPLGNGHMRIRQHPLGPVVQLDAGSSAADIPWEAYPLSISKPGMPHLLEVEFPSDIVQTLGISIVEPNPAGVVTPIGLDSGVYVSEPSAESPPQWQKHRLVFWPRTKSPLLLITNRRTGEIAAYGKIRVLSGPNHLPPAFHPAFDRSERLFAAYLDRPLFNENFGATESLDAWSGRSLDDWQTFYEGATRLGEYLNHAGYNGLMLSVLSDGSTIYPSELLEPTPCYDTGPFFDSGQDPFRKDVLELLMRLFDREGNRLIPVLQFSAPLPALEAQLRENDPQTSGMALIGADGRSFTAGQAPRRGLAPYYNPLNPQVQAAMLAVVRELVQRYGHHSAFAGLAVELSADGYVQLPGEAWGFDDVTIAAFERDKQVRVPGEGPERFAERARYLLGEERKTWLEWRAAKLADFHLRMQRELTAVRPDAVFYLSPTNMLDTAEARRDLRPSLLSRGRVDDVLLSLGIQPALYRDQEGFIFLRPKRVAPPGPVAAEALDIELARSPELDRLASGSALPASLFWHEPQTLRLASFEAKSPFGKDKTYAWLVSQFSPAGSENRKRFVQTLAGRDMDCAAIFDGGWLLPLGQEESLLPLIASYRRLPAAQFETLPCDEPITVRTLVRDGQSYVYLINDSPWPVSVSMQVQMPSGVRADELSGQRRLPPIVGNNWKLELEPYDLVGVRFASPAVRLSGFRVTPPDIVRAELQRRIDDLRHRRAILETPPPLAGLQNPGFEMATRGQPNHWALSATPPLSATAQVERRGGHQASGAVRLTSRGTSASFYSEPFPAPQTGRLSLSVRLRVEDPDEQPALRLAVEGSLDEGAYSPFAMVGRGAAVPIPGDWTAPEFILKIDDVPASGLSDLRVRFDVIGSGTVWIDDVQLFHLEFTSLERSQLARVLDLPAFQLREGKWGDCQRELNGYWPRFLTDNVPLARPAVAEIGEPSPNASADQKQAARPGPIDRVREWWKR